MMPDWFVFQVFILSFSKRLRIARVAGFW